MELLIAVLLLSIIVNTSCQSPSPTAQSLDDLINEIFEMNLNGMVAPTEVPPAIISTSSSTSSPTTTTAAVNPCGSLGECVPYYLCANGTIITDGDGVLDIRFGGEDNPDRSRHPCNGLFETCCSERAEQPTIVATKPLANETTFGGCGYRNKDGVGFRITGDKDNESQFGEFPWTIALIKEEHAINETLSIYQCGGSLIHPSVVLTAAHCVFTRNPSELKIRAGEWDTQTTDEFLPHQDRRVADISIHPAYYKAGLFNDVALLFLEQPVVLADNVNTACLPPQDATFDAGSRCFASGWGKDLFGREGRYQVILKRVELPIVDRDVCEAELRKTRVGVHFQLNRSFVCAGGVRGKDTCKGDGGSPLVCPIVGSIDQYYQAGIVAWGIGCGDQTPGVYVNVALFRDWIDEQMRLKNMETHYYTA